MASHRPLPTSPARRVLCAAFALVASVAAAPPAGAGGAPLPRLAPESEASAALPAIGEPIMMPLGPAASGAAAAPVATIEALPLGQPAARSGVENAKPAAVSSDGLPGWARTGLALGLVLGIVVVLKLIVQRVAGRSGGLVGQLGAGGRAPSGVLEVLGRYPVSRGQSLVLLRMDRRVLLLGQSAQGFRLLTEVSEPEDVASLLVKTRDDDGETNAAKFNTLLREMERDPSVVGEERGGTALTPDGPTSVRRRFAPLVGARS